jgi:signal recognition particle GTPase
LAAADIRRPAAVEQLQKLGAMVGVRVFAAQGEALAVARSAGCAARREAIRC